jgi:hypothetical protein
VQGVGGDAAVAAVEGADVGSAEEVGLADDARAAEGVSGAPAAAEPYEQL